MAHLVSFAWDVEKEGNELRMREYDGTSSEQSTLILDLELSLLPPFGRVGYYPSIVNILLFRVQFL